MGLKASLIQSFSAEIVIKITNFVSFDGQYMFNYTKPDVQLHAMSLLGKKSNVVLSFN